MDTMALPGICLVKKIVRAIPDDFVKYEDKIRAMIQDYFARSLDKTCPPEDGFELLRHRLSRDPLFIMIVALAEDGPVGFMAGDKVRDTARVLMGYMDPKFDKKESESTVMKSLEMFEKWAQGLKSKDMIFYTSRTPWSHKFMEKHGWHHTMTTYGKEI